jgi:UDP-2,3-diacylglucosamine pyrophosphatase LpxH
MRHLLLPAKSPVMTKRQPKIVVISDVHLGTYGCHASELKSYLKSIQPEVLILNGDIIDIWQFRKNYFPKSHLGVLKQILAMASKGTRVYYLTGNHDELLRKFSETTMGNIHLLDKLVLQVDGKYHWFFHGDVFDASIQNARWLAKLGSWGYDFLILLNRVMNFALEAIGRERYSLSKKIKGSVKNAVKFIGDFEKTACELAIDQGYQTVVCGHIHEPQIRNYENDKGSCMYLNSGDWVESLTALEYQSGQWSMFKYHDAVFANLSESEQDDVWFSLNLQTLMQKITETGTVVHVEA